jgi:hypothetical protein
MPKSLEYIRGDVGDNKVVCKLSRVIGRTVATPMGGPRAIPHTDSSLWTNESTFDHLL